jgi:hypothetical protein
MDAVTEVHTVYVSGRATEAEVAVAVDAWRKMTGDVLEIAMDVEGDGYEGMGYSLDVFAIDEDAQIQAAENLAAGLRDLLPGIDIRTDVDLDGTEGHKVRSA